MAHVSSPVLVGSTTSVTFTFPMRTSVLVAIVFYTDADGTVPDTVGAGTATLTATAPMSAFSGPTNAATRVTVPTLAITGGTKSGLAGGTLVEIALGDGLRSIVLTTSAITPPGGSVSYRLLVTATTGS